jgi:hypothetical protein
MNLFHWLFGAPPADPAAGQVWHSENSGKCMRVEQVRRTDHGCLVVSTAYEYEDGWTTPMDHYVRDIAGWRRHLRNEKRVLVSAASVAPSEQGCAVHGLAHPCETCAEESIAEQEHASAVASWKKAASNMVAHWKKHGPTVEAQWCTHAAQLLSMGGDLMDSEHTPSGVKGPDHG